MQVRGKRKDNEECEALSAEEKAECSMQYGAAKDELARAYKNGEYDWDFDLVGKLDSKDASMILRYYSLMSTNAKIENGLSLAADALSDLNGDKMINSSDASNVLAEYSKRATE